MSSDVELHVAYKVANAPIQSFPYPHLYINEVFPPDYYAELQRRMPDPAAMRPIAEVRPVKGYNERFVLGFEDPDLATLPEDQQAFWKDLRGWLRGGRFANMMLGKFGAFVNQRFQGKNVQFYDELLLVQDTTNYKLGPHSDAPRKVITFLFYLPKDDSQRHLGTSIYFPKDPKFRCPGGPHYAHENFERVWTMPFLPNSLFVFVKSDMSFHGVEPVADPDTRRWLLLYDIYHRVAEPAANAPKFSF